jgi:hypothetical protein
MDKEGRWVLWASAAIVALLIAAIFFYFVMFKPNNDGIYSGGVENPASGMSDVEAAAAFNESFVFYLLYSIKAYNLHNPPLSSSAPRIEVDVGGDVFNAVVNDGAIKVARGQINGEDAVIRTSKQEAVKMIRDKNYVVQSFRDGLSSIELAADKTTLFAKGYLNLYTEVTGKSVTGNIIRIYFE